MSLAIFRLDLAIRINKDLSVVDAVALPLPAELVPRFLLRRKHRVEMRHHGDRAGRLPAPRQHEMMAVAVDTEGSFAGKLPRILFRLPKTEIYAFDITKDGQRFLILDDSPPRTST